MPCGPTNLSSCKYARGIEYHICHSFRSLNHALAACSTITTRRFHRLNSRIKPVARVCITVSDDRNIFQILGELTGGDQKSPSSDMYESYHMCAIHWSLKITLSHQIISLEFYLASGEPESSPAFNGIAAVSPVTPLIIGNSCTPSGATLAPTGSAKTWLNRRSRPRHPLSFLVLHCNLVHESSIKPLFNASRTAKRIQ